ncbi:15233_t:CDS:10, partial [Acaulospora colombiana]
MPIPEIENSSIESEQIKQHHGEIIYEPDGFLTKIHRKDSQLNRRIVNTYTGMWKEDGTDSSSKDESIEKRRENAQEMTNAFYDIVTDFYEYGWGESFHFARTCKGDTFEQSIKRHEQYLALKLGLNEKHTVLDVGCGVGGPIREIARLTGSNITGINNNGYQIERCKFYSKKLGLGEKTNFIKGDFTTMPCEFNGKFDSAYAIEATVHSPKLEAVYGEVFRALKPGGHFATYEWVTTPKYDANNPEHVRIVRGIEEGNSIPSLSSYKQALDAARNVGFEVLEHEDLSILSEYHEPWYSTLKGSFSLTGFRMSRIGRWVTHGFVSCLEFLRIAAPGSSDVASFLNSTADALVEATKLGAIVAGQTSVKEPEIKAFEKYLPEDVHIVSCHSLHGPTVDPRGQPLVIIKHRASQERFDLAVRVLSCLESQIVELSYEEHDRITADTQAVTHAAFLSMGTAWKTQRQFPWEVPQYTGGIENVKVLMALRIYSNKWHVYAGLAIMNPSARSQIKQYAQSVSDLFKLMIQEKEEEFTKRVKMAGEYVFGKPTDSPREPMLLSDSILDEFSLSSVPKAKRKPNSHLSLLAMYLFRNSEMLDEAINAALYSKDIRADDMEFYSASKGWAECVEIGSMITYQRRFEDTAKFFEP